MTWLDESLTRPTQTPLLWLVAPLSSAFTSTTAVACGVVGAADEIRIPNQGWAAVADAWPPPTDHVGATSPNLAQVVMTERTSAYDDRSSVVKWSSIWLA